MMMLRILCIVLLLLIPHSARSDVQCASSTANLINSGSDIDTFMNNNNLTMMAWVKSTGSTFGSDACWNEGPFLMDSNEVISVGRSGTSGTGNACTFIEASPSREFFTATAAGWHHIAATYSGGTIVLFVDGVETGSQSGGGNVDMMSGTLHLCGQADGQSPDRLTEVKVYDVLLSSAEIGRLGRSRIRKYDRTTPTGYWPLTDCAHGASGNNVTYRDRSGNVRNITGDAGGAALVCAGSEWISRGMGIQ